MSGSRGRCVGALIALLAALCSMAVAPNGVVYVQTMKELWRVGL